MAFTVAAVSLAAIVFLWFALRYSPEKIAADRFFTALTAGNTELAYKLWKPVSSYSMKDFLADWGPEGYYGPVKSYEILKTCAPRGSNNMIATRVAISPFAPMPDASEAEKSRKTKIVDVWINRDYKSLSQPPEPTSCSFF